MSGQTMRTPYLAGERKLVSVMFADISGFTALSEAMDPEEVRSLVNDCFTCLIPIVERYGGVIDKFIGDEIMALFGAPITHENDAEQAVRAALEMLDAVARFAAERRTDLGMHIGLETGTVVAGGLGSVGHQHYSVMGDPVNVAARLEDASERGQILVGPTMHRLTEPLFVFEALPPLSVKGRQQPVTAHRVVEARAAARGTRGLAGLSSPLVGRDPELGRLAEAVLSLAGGTGRVFALTGEPGLGKSRLVAETRERLRCEVRWAEGRALSYMQGAGYAMARSMLHSLLGATLDAQPTEVAGLLRTTLATLFPQQNHALYPYLARLGDLPLDADEEERLRPVLPEAVRQRIEHAFVEFVRGLCSREPLVMVWEDLHWADPSSLDLLEQLLALVGEMPLLLLLVFRPQEGDTGEWLAGVGERTAVEVIELAPLTAEESGQLIENLLRIENLTDATRELILSRAEGNPFFLEELLRSLIDSGMVLVDGARIVATNAIERLQVPDTVQAVVAARVDRLPPEEKRTLQDASVIGRVFKQPVLAYMLEHEGAAQRLDDCLLNLEGSALIRARHVDFEYIFKHAVTHDVTYNGLLLARRKELHAVAGEAIEALSPSDLDELSETLAYHYQRAGVADKALYYLVVAADRARATFSNVEAVGFYTAALEQAERAAPDRTAELHAKIGDVFALTGRGHEARSAFAEALAATPPDNRVGRARIHRKRANTWKVGRELEKTLQGCVEAEEALGAQPGAADPAWFVEWLDIQLEAAFAHYWLLQATELEALLRRIEPVIEKVGTSRQRSDFLEASVVAAWVRERYHTSDETLEQAQKALALSLGVSDDGDLPRALATREHRRALVGMCHLWRGELDEARGHLERAVQESERIGCLEDLLVGLTYLTVTYRRLHDTRTVRDLAGRCLERAGEGRSPTYVAVARANLGWADWKEGEATSALENLHSAATLWPVHPHPIVWLLAWPRLAVDLTRGRVTEALTQARILVNPPTMGMPAAVEDSLRAAMEAAEDGRLDEAAAALTKSVALAEETGWL